MSLEAGGRNHCATKTHLSHGAAQFLYRFIRFLQRHQCESLKARALFKISVMKPVVPCAGDVDGKFAGDHFAECETAGCVEDRPFNADVVHEFQPAIDSNLS